MGGLAKGLAVIESFTRERPRLSVTEAAEATMTTPAAARRCLRTLEDLGYVRYDGKYFHPTPRMMRLQAAYSDTATLPILARPILESVRDEFNESASLAVLDGSDVLFVARAESTHMASTGVRVGTRLPAPIAAAGRIILASSPDDERERCLRDYRAPTLAKDTLATEELVRERIESDRLAGASYTDEEIEFGVRAVAVAVIDVAGSPRAAIAVSALAARLSMNEMREQVVPVLAREARRLGRML